MTSGSASVLQFPAPAANIKVRRAPLAAGDRGIALTIWVMRKVVEGKDGAVNPQVRQQALSIVHGLDSKDKPGQIAAVLNWVKQNIDFRGEYNETIQSPIVTLQLAGGDCDDHSTLIAAMLKSLGFKTRFQTVAADADDPNQFTHVFAEAFDPTTRQWVALDSTVKESYPGWRPQRVYRSQSWKPMGYIGDDSNFSLNIPQGTAPTDFQTLTQDVFAPLAQGLANKISYGSNSALIGTQFGTSASPGSVGWVWLAVIFGAVLLIARRR